MFFLDKGVLSLVKKKGKEKKNLRKLIACERKNGRNQKGWSFDFSLGNSSCRFCSGSFFTLGMCDYQTGVSDFPFLHPSA